ncbi:MAG: Ig-like domain-containing protein [Gemmataceae bacterium]
MSAPSGVYKAGDTITITVTFSENLVVSSGASLSLALQTGTATLTNSFNNTLTFAYTVQPGDTAADLDYVASNSLTLLSGTVKDAAGNNAVLTLPNPGPANAGSLSNTSDVVIDTTAPTVSSVSGANNTYRLGQTLSITVAFSENVVVNTSGGTPTLALNTGTGTAFATYTSGTGTANLTFTYTVQTGDYSADLDYVATTSLALNNGTIRDAAGNNAVLTLATPGATGSLGNTSNIVVDGVVPVVTSITRTSASPTNAATATFTVVFSESVSGVGISDFTLFTSGGITGASVFSVSSGPGTTYTVTVNTGSGDGAIRLDLTDDDSIVDGASNPLGGAGAGNGNFTGDSVTVDKTPPQIATFTRGDATPTNAGTVHYTITFTKNVTGFTQADLSLFSTTGASITGFTQNSASSYTITIDTGSGSGTVRLDLNDDDSIRDAATNPLNGPGSATINGPAYDIDRTFPTVSSITAANPNPSNATTVDFTVVFSEPVTGVDASDFALTASGVIGAGIGPVTGGGTTWTVTVNTGTGDGTIRLDLTDNDSIIDAATNKLGGTGNGNGDFTTGAVYTIDKTAPTVTSIVRAGANPTNAAQVMFTVTFSEAVTGVGPSDFALTGLGTASIFSVSGDSGNTRTVIVDTGSGDGTIRLDLVDDDSIIDASGNKLGGTGLVNGDFTGETYDIDKTAPVVQSITRVSASPTNASPVAFTVVFSEAVTNVDKADFQLAASGVIGAGITNVSGNGTTWTVTVNTGAGDGSIGLNLVDDDSIIDAAGNKLGGTGLVNGDFTGDVYSIDKTAPFVVSIARNGAQLRNSGPVRFDVTFSEPMYGVDLGDFALAAVGLTGQSFASISGVDGDTTFAVFASIGTGEGTLGLNFVSGAADKAGNTVAAGFTGEAFEIDTVAPTVLSITRLDANPTRADYVDFQVLFSEPVQNLALADFSLFTTGVTSAATFSLDAGTGASRVVRVYTGTGTGVIRLDFTDNNTVTDAAGNVFGGAGQQNHTGDETYTIDRTRPAVSSIVRANGNPASTPTVQFTVTFDDAVDGVDASDFDLVTSGVSGAGIASVTGTGNTRTVTVNTGTGEGTIRLDLLNDGTIADLAGNLLLGGTFTGETYDIDRTAPTVTVSRVGGPIATSQPIGFTVVFSEPIALPFGGANITLNGTADFSGVSITVNNTGDDRTFSVLIDSLLSDGTVIVSVAANAATDKAGNGNTASNTAEVLFDTTAPSVLNISPNAPLVSNQPTARFSVRFSEAVTGVDLNPVGGFDNFTLQSFGGIVDAKITSVSLSPTDPQVYLVDVDTGTGDGTLRLDLTAIGGIIDVASNPLNATRVGDVLLTIDKTAPNAGFNVVFPDPRTTPVDSIDFTLDEAVTGLAVTDFVLTRNGFTVTITGASLLGGGTSYTVTGLAAYTALDGDYRVSFLDSTSLARDAAGNAIPAVQAATFTVDTTAPTATLTRPTAGPTNATSLVFAVEFSEPVYNVDLGGFDGFDNFSLTTTGSLVGAAITDVIQTGASTYEVTVSPGTGVGTVTLVLKSTPVLADLAGNAVSGTPVNSNAVSIDTVAPTVTIDDGDADDLVAAGATLTYTIDVTDANPSIFSLSAADLSNAGSATISVGTITSNPISGGMRYTVPVTAVNGGTIVLRIGASAHFEDAAGNATALPQSDDTVVTVDATAPTVTVNPTAGQSLNTNQQPILFTIEFSEPVFGFTSDEAVLSGTAGGIGSALKLVTPAGDGRTFFVSVSGLTSDGTVRIDVAAGVATDAAGNANTASTGSNVIALDSTAPSVTSILRSNPLGASTNASTAVFEVNFSEAVTGVDTTDFTLNATGLTGAGIASVSGSGTQWFVSVNTGSGNGTLRLDLTDNDTIQDLAANRLGGLGAGNGDFTAGQSYTVDHTPPTVSTITLLDPAVTNFTTVRYRVTFSEPVQVSTVSGADFSAAASGVSFATVSATPVNGGATDTQFDVTVNGVAGNGTLQLNVSAGTATILDAVGNALAAGFTGPAYTIDQTAPTVTVNPAAGQATVANQQPIQFTVLFSEPVIGFVPSEAVLSGTAGGIGGATKLVTNPSSDNRTYLVTITGLTSGGTVQIDVAGGVATDAAGNLNSAGTGSNVITLDLDPPTVTSIVRSNPATSPTNASSVVFAVNFSEPVTGVDESDFSLTATGLTNTAITNVTGSGTQWFVMVVTGNGDGTLRLDLLDDDTIRDLATNRLGGSGTGNGNFNTGQSYSVDRTQPTVSNILRLDPTVTNQSSLRFRVIFSEAVQVATVDGADFAPVTNGVSYTGVSATPVTGGETDTRFDVIVSGVTGNGTLRLDVNGGSATILDAAGNALALSFNGPTYTVDQTAPTVTVNQAASQADPANSLPIRFLIVFSEAVPGFNSSMITRTGTAVGGTIGVANPTTDNRTFEVTVNGITGDGTVTLGVAAGAITDAAGNPNVASTFTDNTVAVDTTPPAVSVPDLAAADDSGTSATDNITNVARPTFSGTAEAGATVSLLIGSTVLGTTTATGGTWSITPGTAFVDGTYGVFARAVDAAGNVANSGTLTVVIDTVGPTVAVTRAAGQGATANASSPAFTAQFAVTFSQAVPGLNASQLTVGGTAGGTITNVSGSGASYVVTVGNLTNPGTVTVNVLAGVGSDAAGNASTASPTGEQVTVGFTTQTQLQVTPPAIVPGGTATATATVSAPAGSTPTGSVAFSLTGPGGVINHSVNLAAGVATADFPSLAAGSYSISATFIPSGGYLTSSSSGNFTVQDPYVPPLVDQNSVGDYAGVADRAVTVYDKNGSVLRTFSPFTAAQAPGGVRVAVADVNGDGVADVIAVTGPGSPALLRAFNGKSNALMYELSLFEGFTGGAFVSAGDLNGDGKADLAVTPDQGGGPRVTVFSGPDGTVLANFFGIDDPNFRGGARTAIGDLNGDGKNDLLVAAGFGGGPRVSAIDGTTLTGTRTKLFGDFFLFEEQLRNGAYVTIGDLNGDGFGDIIGGGGPGGGPRVLAIDGKQLIQKNTQTPIANFFAGDDSLRGGVRVAAKDFDGDGKADLVTGSGDTGDLFVYFDDMLTSANPTRSRAVQLTGILDGVYVG